MAIVAVSVAPAGIGQAGMSEYIARALQVVAEDGRVQYQLGPMFTTMEGELADCLDVCRKMHEALLEMGAPRVGTVIKIDDRRDKAITMDGKVNSVERKL